MTSSGKSARLASAVVALCSVAILTGADWPTYLHDAQRDATGSDTALSVANATQLKPAWNVSTGGPVAASAAVVNGVAYVGSWDGNEYALDAATGAVRWKAFLGVTTSTICKSPSTAGVSSSAAVVNGTVYVGGGDSNWYALDAATGHTLWTVPTGDNSTNGGHYNWSSPLIYTDPGDNQQYAYVGIASFGDCPLVQGQLLKVSLAQHKIVAMLNIVPNGHVGGGIWTSPSVDPASNRVYVTTGTKVNSDSPTAQQYSQAIVAVDATSLAITDHWQLPDSEAVTDSDWGTTPTLFSDKNGRPLVSAINKNGFVYAWDRTNLAGGHVWRMQVAIGGQCPTCGQGSVSSSAFGDGKLYVAAGNTTTGGTNFKGSVRALDPLTGSFLWQHGAPGVVVPALAYDNGLVVDGAGSTMEVLDAATGTSLVAFSASSIFYGAPSIANGEIFIGSIDHKEYAFGIPGGSPGCPTGWTCADIGGALPAGDQSLSAGAWTIRGGGSDIHDTADHFHFVWKSLASDGTMSAHVTSQTNTNAWAKAGVMLRAAGTGSSDPSAPNYAALVTPGNGVTVQSRASEGGTTANLHFRTTFVPVYLRVQRSGSTFSAYTSADGTTWTLLAGSTKTLTMTGAVSEGMAVSSHQNGTLSTVTMDTVVPS